MKKTKQIEKIPLILRFHRLMDCFAKSDDERDFYLDRNEGFLVFVDLDKGQEELKVLEEELTSHSDRYCLFPKMTFFEVKKFMEGFVQEKVYDIDTKEKLLDIISSKNPRMNFLEHIYDNLTELEKWQVYYQERSRIRIIEWLRNLQIHFVFEEDLDLHRNIIEKLKRTFFDKTIQKDVSQAQQLLLTKAKTYYSNEALNPRPKRGRPPKQAAKVSIEPQFTMDIYSTVPKPVRLFLYIPDITSASSVTFSAEFESEEQLLASLRGSDRIQVDEKLEALSQRLESLQQLSSRLAGQGVGRREPYKPSKMPKGITPKEEKEIKIESAIEEALPGRKAKEGEFVGQKRKRFGIKKVSPIKSSRKKK